MKNKQQRKPTIMEVKNVINNMLQDMVHMQRYIKDIDAIFTAYVDFKDDHEKFSSHIESLKKKSMEKSNESNGENSGESSTGDRKAAVASIKPAGKKSKPSGKKSVKSKKK